MILLRVSCHRLISGMLVVAIIIAPASFINRTHSASAFARTVRRAVIPSVCSRSLTAVLSLVVNGTPRKGLAFSSAASINPCFNR
uniref:Putative secreted protein n=1 Tax=Anopheles darlingi TaxID=43151 RepID=A0A2M4D369_ANODA